jgi:hypothetical protein
VPVDAQQILAAAGIRDEQVFPTPSLLELSPNLVGYYRLLLGLPQKTFYGAATGMGRFKNMEVKGVMGASQRSALDDFCAAMAEPLAELVRQLSPTITSRDIHELPLLTLGSQFQGANNNVIGRQATLNVFLAISDIVSDYVTERTTNRLSLIKSAGRLVVIKLAGDPDVSVEEHTTGQTRKIVAIEIKGGTDKSNAHNRAGEAEKSHQKAKLQGFRDYWTIISTHGLDMAALRSESPSTTVWFDVAQILAREGSDWTDFVNNLSAEVGIPAIRD